LFLDFCAGKGGARKLQGNGALTPGFAGPFPVNGRGKIKGILVGSAVFSFCAAWLGAATPVRLETSLEPREATVGDPVALTVKVVAEPGVDIRPFAPGKTLGLFEVRSFVPDAPREEAGRLTQTFHWTLAAYDVGVATVPALAFSYQSKGGKVQEIQSPEMTLAIKSVLGPDAKDIRGLKKPWRGPPPWGLYAIALALVGIGVFLGILRRRRRPKMPPVPPRPAHEAALEALDRLEGDRPASAKVFYSRLSEIFRAYLLGRYGVSAPDLTTAEILNAIKRVGLPADSRLTARDLLEVSDLAKFAKMDPGDESRLRHLALARAFVLATKPIETLSEEA
jgi:hypothetical protein